jgi:hypothetical protein
LLADRYVRPYFVSGPDGKIDHTAFDDHDQVVIECKFFGRNRKDEPESDWNKIAIILKKNLLSAEEAGSTPINSLFDPWYDQRRPIKGYWFCTSGEMTPAVQSALRNKIKKFFEDRADDNPTSLGHLASLGVEVLAWNDFRGALLQNPPLNFRWFRSFPTGLRHLRSLVQGKTFRTFMKEEVLPF